MTTNPPKAPYGHLPNGTQIFPGPEHELVGEDEGISPNCEYTFDGITWLPCAEGANAKVKECVQPPSLIIAIRRRKVVKEQAGDKSILEKGGDELCVTTTKDSVQVANASPAPEPTAQPDAQGASISRIVLALRELANALENKH